MGLVIFLRSYYNTDRNHLPPAGERRANMAKYGFIHDKLDIKMLELYLLSRAVGGVDFDTLTELCMAHEGVEYFDFAEATAELVSSGHLLLDGEEYTITEKGRVNSLACESSLAPSVRRRCDRDIAAVNVRLRRNAQIRGESRRQADGSVMARMTLDDDGGNLLTLELLCPSQEQAGRLIDGFKARPEQVYNQILGALLSTGEEED